MSISIVSNVVKVLAVSTLLVAWVTEPAQASMTQDANPMPALGSEGQVSPGERPVGLVGDRLASSGPIQIRTTDARFGRESAPRGIPGVGVIPRLTRQGTITGQVVDAVTRQPLSATQVRVDELDLIVLTQANGNFSFSDVPAGTYTLAVERLGYRPASEVVTVVSGETVQVNFDLATEAVALEELVVVGYGVQARASLSGAVTSIDNAAIERTSATTVADMLVGKVAGINTRLNTSGASVTGSRVPTDGRPGGTTTLQIRNMGNPLFVIDGVPSSDLDFNHLNASDIDNISVLKDASASVYGFRAANGVVLVTTKRGQEATTPQVSVSGYYGWQNLPRDRYPSGYGDTSYQLFYSYVESQQNRGESRTMSAEELENWRLGGPDYPNREMWKFFIEENAPQWTFNTSISGGSDNSTYYLSLGHVSQDYAMPDNNFSRTNLQANLTSELFSGFTIGSQLRARQEQHLTVAITDAGVDPLLHYFRAISTAWPWEDPYANGNPSYINGDVHYFIRSPVAFTRDNSGWQDRIMTNYTGNFWAQYVLPFGTSVRATYQQAKDLEEYDVHRYTFDGFCYDASTDTYEVCQSYGGQARWSVRGVGDQNFWNIQLNHTLERGSHTLSGVAALERTSGDVTTTELNSVPPTNFSPLIDFVDVTNAETSWSVERRASYVGRLNYDYEAKYLLEALGRYDGSHLYAPGRRWGFFPGVSVAWRLTEEDFFRDALPFMNELKFRASWGQTGREQGIAPWGFLGGATYGAGTPTVLDGQVVTGIQPRGLPVTNLSWVTSTSRNIGVDFIVLDGRLAGEFDLFERRLTGLPAARYDVALPSELGYSLPNENLESEANRGFEGMIRYSDQIGRVAFSIAPNFTLSREKILDRYRPRYGNSWDRYRNGTENRWAGATSNQTFIRGHIGQFQTMEEIERHPVNIDGQGNRTLLPGDLIYEDVNGDGIINALDFRPRGFPLGTPPVFSYGLNGTLSYAGFTLSYDFAGGGMYSWNPSNLVTVPHQTDYNGFTSLSNRWRRVDPFDDHSEWIPGKFPPLRRAQTSHSSYQPSDFNRINVRFLRLKRLELGYTVPGQVVSHLGLANLRLYTSFANPLVFDNTRRFAVDPEIANTSAFQHPYATVLNLGFSATFGGSPQ